MYCRLDDFNQFRVALLFVVQEPGTFLYDRHIGGNQHAMVEVVMAEILLVATVCRKSFVFQLLEVDVLCFVDVQIIQ